MERVVEPELMIDPLQVQEYYASDRNRNLYKQIFKATYQSIKKQTPANMVDLGCGPGDLTVEMAELHPDTPVVGIDNSDAMLALAADQNNVIFKKLSITDIIDHYDRVISSITLHHFHNPMNFWETIKRISPRDVFIVDLVRPDNEAEVQQILRLNEPYGSDLFKLDFENSLRAAFTIKEIQQQLNDAGIKLTIHEMDIPHLKIPLVLITGMLEYL